jgi:hypothetical protein
LLDYLSLELTPYRSIFIDSAKIKIFSNK